MVLRAFLDNWLHGTAKARVREALVRAAREQLAQPAEVPAAGELKPCHVGFVFALGIESGCFEDLLQGVVTIRSHGFRLREGGLAGRRIVLILSGAGRENARRATEILIDGHRPGLVISAGFAGGLSPEMRRNDILVADRLLGGEAELRVNTSAMPCGSDVHHGTLLTVDGVVGSPSERRTLWQAHAALAVDMETIGVAQVCQRRRIPFASVRVINDLANEALPSEVEHLLRQKTGAARLGATLGAVCRRPASLKAMYQLHENALVASGRLGRFLTECMPPVADNRP